MIQPRWHLFHAIINQCVMNVPLDTLDLVVRVRIQPDNFSLLPFLIRKFYHLQKLLVLFHILGVPKRTLQLQYQPAYRRADSHQGRDMYQRGADDLLLEDAGELRAAL